MLVRQGEQCLSGKNSTCIIVSIKVGLKNETCLFFYHGHQGHLSLGLCKKCMGRRWLVQEECKNIKYFQIEWKSQIEDFQHRKDGKHMK